MKDEVKNYWHSFFKDKQPINEKEPKEKCEFVRMVGITILQTIGIELLDPNYKPYALSYLAGFCLIDYFSLTFYTLYLYRDDIWRAIEPTCIFGIIIPVG